MVVTDQPALARDRFLEHHAGILVVAEAMHHESEVPQRCGDERVLGTQRVADEDVRPTVMHAGGNVVAEVVVQVAEVDERHRDGRVLRTEQVGQ